MNKVILPDIIIAYVQRYVTKELGVIFDKFTIIHKE